MSTVDEAESVNQAMADPAPEMPKPFNGSIPLLRGVHQVTEDIDTWHTVAQVRELTGADEEYLASLEDNDDLTYTEYMNGLLERAVEYVGDLDVQAAPGVLGKLILPDRDMLFLAVVKATYGKIRKMRAMCMHCETLNDVEIDLDEDFKVEGLDLDLREPFEVETSKGIVRLRMPNGEDTLAVQDKERNDAEVNTLMLSRCVVFDEGKAPEDTVEWARNLNIRDRKNLVSKLTSVKAGPSLEGVETQCAECGKTMPILLDWVSLLLS